MPSNLETLLEGSQRARSGDRLPTRGLAHHLRVTRRLKHCARFADTQTEARPASSPKAAAIEGRAGRGECSFVPSPELVERGVKIDTIRARLLRDRKDSFESYPQVRAEGSISFQFEVQTEGRSEPRLLERGRRRVRANAVSRVFRWSRNPPRPWRWRPLLAPGRLRPGAPANFVRVDLARLDDLMRLAGDLVVTRARLDDTLGTGGTPRAGGRAPALLQEHESLMKRQSRDLRARDHARSSRPGWRGLSPRAVRGPRPRPRCRQARLRCGGDRSGAPRSTSS